MKSFNPLTLAIAMCVALPSLTFAQDDPVMYASTMMRSDNYISLEALLLWREDLDDDVLADNDDTATTNDYRADNLDFDHAPGLIARFGFLFEDAALPHIELNAIAFGFDSYWLITTPGQSIDLAFDDDVNPAAEHFGNADSAQAAEFEYESTFLGVAALAEIHHTYHGLVFRAGPSFIQYESKLSGRADDEAQDFSSSIDEIIEYDVDVVNRLYGAQIAAEYHGYVTSQLAAHGRLTLGAYVNKVDVDSQTLDEEDPTDADSLKNAFDETLFATLVQFEPELQFKPTENLLFSLGGFVQWMTGIAESTEAFYDIGVINHDSIGSQNMLVYGGKAGASLRF